MDDRVTEAQVEGAEFLLGIRPEQDNGAAGSAGLVDGRPWQGQEQVGGKAVSQLRIHVVGSQHALGELRPRVLSLVGEPGAADNRYSVRRGGTQRLCRDIKGLVPRCSHQLGSIGRPVAEGVALQ